MGADKESLLPPFCEGGNMIYLHNFSPRKGSRFERKRVGRGPGSGLGRTGGRGQKGQKSREGYRLPRGFEGGQMPLFRRIPKRGFTPPFPAKIRSLNLFLFSELPAGTVVDKEYLYKNGFLKPQSLDGVKILGKGDLKAPLIFRVQGVSDSARKKIEAVGGRVEIVPWR